MKFEFKSLFDLLSALLMLLQRSTNAKVTNTAIKILENTSMSRLVLFLTILKLNFVNGLWQFGL